MDRESVGAILSRLDDDSGDKRRRKSQPSQGVMDEVEPTEDVQLPIMLVQRIKGYRYCSVGVLQRYRQQRYYSPISTKVVK
jgi:hypothetical protein